MTAGLLWAGLRSPARFPNWATDHTGVCSYRRVPSCNTRAHRASHPIPLLFADSKFPIVHHVSETICETYRKGLRDVPKPPLAPDRNVRLGHGIPRKASIATGNFGMYRNLTIRGNIFRFLRKRIGLWFKEGSRFPG